MTRTVRILREPDVRAALDMTTCIDAVERAFAAYANGEAELPAVIHLDVPEAQGEIHVKAGHLHGAPAYAVKVASGFYGSDPPAIDGMVVVFDARDGAPRVPARRRIPHGHADRSGGRRRRSMARPVAGPHGRRDRNRGPGPCAGRGAARGAPGHRGDPGVGT